MPTFAGHIATGISLGYALNPEEKKLRFYLSVILLSIIPDFDVIMFRFGIPYVHPLGHRGFFHSFLFAAITGAFMAYLYLKKQGISPGKYFRLSIIFILTGLMHSLLDAMTNGGLGIGFFIPFNYQRYFLPWKPIEVSPIGITGFFSNWGLKVLKNEFMLLVIPSIALVAAASTCRKLIKYWRIKNSGRQHQ